MADNIDAKTRRIAEKRINKGQEYQAYQEAQNQLLSIQAERRQNLAQSKLTGDADIATNNILSQSTTLMSDLISDSSQTANFNPTTTNILGSYGVKSPHTVKKSTERITKQNIIINNKTENITKVPANIGGPVQGRPIQFQGPDKVKNWVNAVLNQQNELARKRDLDYERRDLSLVRSTNRLISKLESAGEAMMQKLTNPQMGTVIGSSIKTLFLMLGIGQVTKSWPKIMERLNNIATLFNRSKEIIGADGQVKDSLFKKLSDRLVRSLGGKEGETVGEAFRKLFKNTDDNPGIFDLIKKKIENWLKVRAKALGNLEYFEERNSKDDDKSGWLSGILKNASEYLKNALSAILTGDAGGLVRSELNKNVEEQERDNLFNQSYEGAGLIKNPYRVNITESTDMKFKNGNIVNPESSIVNMEKLESFKNSNQDLNWTLGGNNDKNRSRSILTGGSIFINKANTYDQEKSYFDPDIFLKNGKLIEAPESTISQSLEIAIALKKSRLESIELGGMKSILVGISRLYDAAKNQGSIPVDITFLEEMANYGKKEKIKYENGRYVLKIVRTDIDKEYGSQNTDTGGKHFAEETSWLTNNTSSWFDVKSIYAGVLRLVESNDKDDLGDGNEAYIFPKVDAKTLLDCINKFANLENDKKLESSEIDLASRNFDLSVLNSVVMGSKNVEDAKNKLSEFSSLYRLNDDYKEELRKQEQDAWNRSRPHDAGVYIKESVQEKTEKVKDEVAGTVNDVGEFVENNITPNGAGGGDSDTPYTNTINQDINNYNITGSPSTININNNPTETNIEIDSQPDSKNINVINDGKFDINQAINWIHENQNKVLYNTDYANKKLELFKGDRKKIDQSIGACAGYVRRAINAGGIKTPNNPISAYQYSDYLPKIGFTQINNESKLRKGDISVESATPSHKHGHIAIWDGTRWNSDFLQNNRKVHKSDSGNFTLWRYGRLNNNLIENKLKPIPLDKVEASPEFNKKINDRINYTKINYSIKENPNKKSQTDLSIAAGNIDSVLDSVISSVTMITQMVGENVGVSKNVSNIITTIGANKNVSTNYSESMFNSNDLANNKIG